jgi:hypothetical protein
LKRAKRVAMSDKTPTSKFHSNRYHAQAACEHCAGVIRHEPWCITRDPVVYYAYQIVADPSKLTPGDALILHSLGAIWDAKPGQRACQTNAS